MPIYRMSIVLVLVLGLVIFLDSCTGLNKFVHSKTGHVIEEIAEEEIDHFTGLDLEHIIPIPKD